jgi:hypothetical protein
MSSIPVDVLREILGHVRKADLATLCRVNKIFCSCSQNVLYRNIYNGDERVIPTLAQSTDLARRVRSFDTTRSLNAMRTPPELATALRNMSSLRSLYLDVDDASILDGCTFKLDSFTCYFPNSESLQNFLNSQPSITRIALLEEYEPFPPVNERCLPNLTRVCAPPSWLDALIPGRSVREVDVAYPSSFSPTDLGFFTLSATPIQKLRIYYDRLYPTPVSHLVSIFSSLVHLEVYACDMDWPVRVPLCLSI